VEAIRRLRHARPPPPSRRAGGPLGPRKKDRPPRGSGAGAGRPAALLAPGVALPARRRRGSAAASDGAPGPRAFTARHGRYRYWAARGRLRPKTHRRRDRASLRRGCLTRPVRVARPPRAPLAPLPYASGRPAFIPAAAARRCPPPITPATAAPATIRPRRSTHPTPRQPARRSHWILLAGGGVSPPLPPGPPPALGEPPPPSRDWRRRLRLRLAPERRLARPPPLRSERPCVPATAPPRRHVLRLPVQALSASAESRYITAAHGAERRQGEGITTPARISPTIRSPPAANDKPDAAAVAGQGEHDQRDRLEHHDTKAAAAPKPAAPAGQRRPDRRRKRDREERTAM